jgi:hypothetical protein
MPHARGCGRVGFKTLEDLGGHPWGGRAVRLEKPRVLPGVFGEYGRT